VFLDHALNDEEGRGLVAAIHERHRERRLEALREGRRIRPGVRHLAVLFPFGVFR
jgi:hypothetical protein